ncbi:MAG: type II toxin-antitoxin system HipA family toxin [Bacteroidetes bacterium]|nr:MAG: type II toxin-antitoxin system HipA family toxin [Bacteroidota bacterium]
MDSITRLIVSLDWGDEQQEVGELVFQDRKIFYKYYPDFIDYGLEISPFKLPLSQEILQPDTMVFDGLFGVFFDSLPDGWGRLLIDRMLISRGIGLDSISALDRLAIVGKDGMGSLSYKPAKGPVEKISLNYDLDEIAEASRRIYEGESSKLLDHLVEIGGSSGGARPKIFVGYNSGSDQLIYGETKLPKGFEDWIIKFPSSSDPEDIAMIEFSYYKMALEAGLEMSECRLFRGASGRFYFGTKRFDRFNGHRRHLHSASGLLHDNFRLSNLDYGHLMDAAFRLENSVEAYQKVLRLAAFNVFSHNRDDHSKNFSFLMDKKGTWKLAPVYDLTFSYSSHGFHSTTVNGEGKNPGSKQLLELADIFGLKDGKKIIEQVKESIVQWGEFANETGVGSSSKKQISIALNKLIKE